MNVSGICNISVLFRDDFAGTASSVRKENLFSIGIKLDLIENKNHFNCIKNSNKKISCIQLKHLFNI